MYNILQIKNTNFNESPKRFYETENLYGPISLHKFLKSRVSWFKIRKTSKIDQLVFVYSDTVTCIKSIRVWVIFGVTKNCTLTLITPAVVPRYGQTVQTNLLTIV